MRLNDAEEFIEWLLDHIWDEEDWFANRNALDEMIMRKLSALGYIQEKGDKYVRKGRRKEKTKTVDAEPIRHGHWIPVNPDMYRAEYFECSVCGMYSRDGLFRKELGYEYCPNCGAKMDAKGENDAD